LPILAEAEASIVDEIASSLVHECDEIDGVVDLSLDWLYRMKPAGIPSFVTPDEVISYFLYELVLPAMPLANTDRHFGDDIDELLSAGVPPMALPDDLQDPLVLAMVKKYKKDLETRP
jgi:hypothetical protein